MPGLQFSIPEVTPKSLNMRMSRSATLFTIKRANYMGFVLPKLEKLIRTLNESAIELSKPVQMKVGTGENERVIEVMDYANQAKIANALLAAMDHERALLGFPSPGRRRDESAQPERNAKSAPSSIDLSALAQAESATAQQSTAQTAQPAPAPSERAPDGTA